jgi:hypothetical protein
MCQQSSIQNQTHHKFEGREKKKKSASESIPNFGSAVPDGIIISICTK